MYVRPYTRELALDRKNLADAFTRYLKKQNNALRFKSKRNHPKVVISIHLFFRKILCMPTQFTQQKSTLIANFKIKGGFTLIQRLGMGLMMVVFIFAFSVHSVDAATYVQGIVKFDDLAQTPEFHLTKGQKILSLTKQATKDASFEIQLTNINGKVVDTCIGDAYTFKTKGECYFHSPADCKYYLTFITYDTTSTITMKYRLHD